MAREYDDVAFDSGFAGALEPVTPPLFFRAGLAVIGELYEAKIFVSQVLLKHFFFVRRIDGDRANGFRAGLRLGRRLYDLNTGDE